MVTSGVISCSAIINSCVVSCGERWLRVAPLVTALNISQLRSYTIRALNISEAIFCFAFGKLSISSISCCHGREYGYLFPPPSGFPCLYSLLGDIQRLRNLRLRHPGLLPQRGDPPRQPHPADGQPRHSKLHRV